VRGRRPSRMRSARLASGLARITVSKAWSDLAAGLDFGACLFLPLSVGMLGLSSPLLLNALSAHETMSGNERRGSARPPARLWSRISGGRRCRRGEDRAWAGSPGEAFCGPSTYYSARRASAGPVRQHLPKGRSLAMTESGGLLLGTSPSPSTPWGKCGSFNSRTIACGRSSANESSAPTTQHGGAALGA
jgi:hypothetical protein